MGVDPEQIATVADLTEQLRALFDQTGQSYERLGTSTGLAPATLHELVNKSDSFPRRDTVREFVLACRQDEGPWMRAWARVEQARARPVRPSTQDLRAEADSLRRDLEQARQQLFNAEVSREATGQVADKRIQELTHQLTSMRQELDQARQELDRQRPGQEAATALARLEQPRFRSAFGAGAYNPSYVRELMDGLHEAALEGPAAVIRVLTFISLGRMEGINGHGPAVDDVDNYLAAVRQAMNRLLNRDGY